MPNVFGTPSKRKVFISYCANDRATVDSFVNYWAIRQGVFTPKMVGGTYGQDIIDSTDTNYVMGRLRTEYLSDSTVTLVLLGSCTHSRRYVDWELKASLRQGSTYTPNGLLGILLPTYSSGIILPERFTANWPSANYQGYANYHWAPESADQLRRWIEEAYERRTSQAHLIENSADRMLYNARCQVCGVTH